MILPRLFTLSILFQLTAILAGLCLAQHASCTIPGTHEQGVQGAASDPLTGKPTCLLLNRRPALYTQSFGDCLGSSEMQVNRFSAAYYKDNMTLSFDLEGRTDLDNVNTIIYISVFAYGENRFQYIWNPCGSSAQTICPTNKTRPFTSNLLIPLGESDVGGIPDIAFQIPNFEGQAIMRIFSNNTQQEIACYSAVVSNGLTFSQPAAVGTIVGLFVLVGLASSVATAVYGSNIVENRLHYAHSMSVWVIFAVLQHVFLTGALSLNWPSVLPAWWSNFAWAAGMIYSPSMQNSIDAFVGNDRGDTTFVGAASTGKSSDSTGGGYSKGQILSAANSQGRQRRAVEALFRAPALMKDAIRSVEAFNNRNNLTFNKRDDDEDFTWFGDPVTPGLPLPGNYSGFAGTLSLEGIPASNAFMTGFLWLIIVIVILASAAVALKWTTEALMWKNWIRQDRLSLFRKHWQRFAGQVALRTCYVAFFLIMFLTMFQFSYHGAGSSIGIASIVFILVFVGAICVAGGGCWYRLRHGDFVKHRDRLHVELVKAFPPLSFSAESERTEKIRWTKSLFSVPWLRIEYINQDPSRTDIHHDEDFIKRFGWLAARFRPGKWWFFVFWLGYDFLRAIFLGGAAGHPQTQVFALLVIEFVAFCVLIRTKPFEANRLNTLMIYLLGLSKILTTALSSAFDPIFNLSRIVTAALGVIIIVIQALLILAMLILIVIGAVSTYISLTRNRDAFYPEHWRPAQTAYMEYLTGKALRKDTSAVTVEELGVLEGEPVRMKQGFRVDSIRRVPKIGDADIEAQEMDPFGSQVALSDRASPVGTLPPPLPGTHTRKSSRALSTASGNLPFGARPARSESWSTRDFQTFNPEMDGSRESRMPGGLGSAFQSTESLHQTTESEGYQIVPTRGRASTLRSIRGTPVGSRSHTPSGLRRTETADDIPLKVVKTRSTKPAQ